MNQIRRPLLLVALALAALGLAACGSSTKTVTETTTSAGGGGKAPASAQVETVPPYAGDPSAKTKPSQASISSLKQLPPRGTTVGPKIKGSDAPLDQWLDSLSTDVSTYWQQVFNNSKLEWPPTKQAIVTQTVQSQCGGAIDTNAVPRYCPPDSTVYLPVGFFQSRVQPLGDGATATLVALIWGYRVADVTGAFKAVQEGKLKPIDVNLQSICFAGAYLHSLGEKQLLQPGDQEEALKLAAATADQGTPSDVSKGSGTAAQRSTALQTGYGQGPGACQKITAG